MATVNVVVTGMPTESVTVHDGDMVVVRFHDEQPMSVMQEACEGFVAALRRLGTDVSCVVIGPRFGNPTVNVFSEVDMRQMGWVRVPDRLNG